MENKGEADRREFLLRQPSSLEAVESGLRFREVFLVTSFGGTKEVTLQFDDSHKEKESYLTGFPPSRE